MNPADRTVRFLQVAGIDRPATKMIRVAGVLTEKIVPLQESERAAAFRAAAAQALELHRTAEQSRDLTVSAARQAVTNAITVGEFLLEMTELFSGEFVEWLENWCAPHLGKSTAYNYMRATKHKAALGEDCPDFATLKDLYVSAGILPKPSSNAEERDQTAAPLFRLRFDLNAPPVEEWEPLTRRDFLEKAKPIVDLYERAKAAESAA